MENSHRSPAWLTGLVIVFAMASAITFGLFLYKHAEESSLYEYLQQRNVELVQLRVAEANIAKLIGPADEAIALRRQKITELAASEKDTTEDINRLVASNTVSLSKITEAMAKEKKTYLQLLEDAKARRLELGQSEQQALTSEREFDDRRLKVREQIEALSKELEAIKRDSRKNNAGLDIRTTELQDRVRQLSQQREVNNRELHSDGQLIASRATDGFVIIDRGQQQNLRKGTRFVVYNKRGGKNIIKGAIEVVEVEARMSTCRVTEEHDANDPLVPGDQIHNPVYNPTAIKRFVIKGDFQSFSKDELKRFIEESGGKVDADLSVNCDYLVAGDRADAALDQATKLGISILSEDQLLDFVRYTPKFAVRQGMIFVLKGRFTAVGESTITSFISRNGGVVESNLRNGTNVLIVGEGAVDDVSKARLLGVTIVDQTQFAHLAGGQPAATGK